MAYEKEGPSCDPLKEYVTVLGFSDEMYFWTWRLVVFEKKVASQGQKMWSSKNCSFFAILLDISIKVFGYNHNKVMIK